MLRTAYPAPKPSMIANAVTPISNPIQITHQYCPLFPFRSPRLHQVAAIYMGTALRNTVPSACRGKGGNVRFGSKADIGAHPRHVCFTPESGHRNSAAECPL